MASEVENTSRKIIRIILTGPESTGKTALTTSLAAIYKVGSIQEYAREYIASLKRPYTYKDVLHIAQTQVRQLENHSKKADSMLFVDTYLIITKIWFVKVYGEYPLWIDSEIGKTRNDLYLLLKPDIPWIQDEVRENGGAMRELLFRDYEKELIKAKLNYKIVGGTDNDRIDNAHEEVQKFINSSI